MITGRVEEWWKYYLHEDYPKCSYCTCPDNCVVVNKSNKSDNKEIDK